MAYSPSEMIWGSEGHHLSLAERKESVLLVCVCVCVCVCVYVQDCVHVSLRMYLYTRVPDVAIGCLPQLFFRLTFKTESVLDSFVSTWHKLKSSERRGPQL